jgi:hypothetical protein
MVSDLLALADDAGVGAPPPASSGRVKEDGAGASPSTERCPGMTLTPAAGEAVCSNRKTENTTDVIPPPGKPEDPRRQLRAA